MWFRYFQLGLFYFCFIISNQASAESINHHYFRLSAGDISIFEQTDDAAIYKAEYRFVPKTRWQLAPTVGYAHSEDGSEFIFTHVERDIYLSSHWVFIPSFGIGVFEDGRHTKLGHDIEFITGLMLAYQFENATRIGLGIFHLSNSGIGDTNPGTEPLLLSVAFPIFKL